jgi:hypothetical protein
MERVLPLERHGLWEMRNSRIEDRLQISKISSDQRLQEQYKVAIFLAVLLLQENKWHTSNFASLQALPENVVFAYGVLRRPDQAHSAGHSAGACRQSGHPDIGISQI